MSSLSLSPPAIWGPTAASADESSQGRRQAEWRGGRLGLQGLEPSREGTLIHTNTSGKIISWSDSLKVLWWFVFLQVIDDIIASQGEEEKTKKKKKEKKEKKVKKEKENERDKGKK